MLVTTAALLVTSPVVLSVAVVVDLAHLRRKYPTVRLSLFAMQYTFNDSAEILAAPLLWLAAGLRNSTRWACIDSSSSAPPGMVPGCHGRRAERLLGLRLDVDAGTTAALTPGPVIVLCRHVNIIDASIPTLLYERVGYRSRGVIMAEMLADPGFDLIYRRTGSVFIPRDNGPEARCHAATPGHRDRPANGGRHLPRRTALPPRPARPIPHQDRRC